MILSGKPLAETIEEEIRQKIALHENLRKPTLAVLLIGFHSPSHTYVNMKRKACSQVGIESILYTFHEKASELEVLQKIQSLNENPNVDGILLQLPLPLHMNTRRLLEAISPQKDIDGLHPLNMGKLLLGIPDGFVPCTPLGIQLLLSRSGIEVTGKHVVIVGRSQIVGKPLAALLMQNAPGGNATVTVAHSKSQNLSKLTFEADILIVALGVPRFIKASMVKENAVVIDVGINRVEDSSHSSGYRLVGDVDFDDVAPKCFAITPVPKGVGPMTVAMLLHNTLLSFERNVR